MSIERFASGSPFEASIGYSRVVRAGDLYVTAGCTSTVQGKVVHEGDPHGQALTAFGIGIEALEGAGCPKDLIIQSRMYITDPSFAEPVGRAHSELFADIRPAATMLVVTGLLDERMLVEIELTAFGG